MNETETQAAETATTKQLDLLHVLTSRDWRSTNITKAEASEMIGRLLEIKRDLGAEAATKAGAASHEEYASAAAEQREGSMDGEEEQAQDKEERPGKKKGKGGKKGEAKAQSNGLEDGIVEIVKRRRDEVLEGIELGVREERKVLVLRQADLPDREIEGHQHQKFERLLEVMHQRDHVLAVGPAGTGKTSSGKLAAKALGLEWTYWACNPRVTASALLGFMDANGGYVRTQFRDAYEHGRLFILDEMDNAASDLLVALNGAIENGHAAFPDGIIERHPDFVVLGTANTYGKGANRVYSGRQQLDGATLDRFLVLDWGYDEALERKLAPVDDWTDYVQAVRKVVEEHAIREVVSMRASMKGGKYLNLGWSWAEVEETLLLRGWAADARSKIEPVRQRFAPMAKLYPGAAKGA